MCNSAILIEVAVIHVSVKLDIGRLLEDLIKELKLELVPYRSYSAEKLGGKRKIGVGKPKKGNLVTYDAYFFTARLERK